MRGRMTFIDSAVVDVTERVCRRFQLLTGRTNVWLGFQLTNLSIVMYFVWAVVLYLSSADLTLRIFVALFCGGVFLVLVRTVLKVPIEASEVEAYRRVAKGLRNPKRVRDVQLRISFLTLSLVLGAPGAFIYVNVDPRPPVLLLAYSLIVLTTVVLYVLACDPLPPCAGKVRQWIAESLRARFAPAPVPVPVVVQPNGRR
jgi:hypothetical protein